MDIRSPPGRLEEEIACLRQDLAVLRINLAVKDWLTVEEAAFYCGVSRSQFDSHISAHAIEPRNFMGKKLYEKAALYRAIYDSKQWAEGTARGVASTPSTPAAAEAMAKLARYEEKKKMTKGKA
ncbi:hypothetical protein [Stenotrophomonas sp. PS02289]|uniref:hypothetical protein n=1 Tax=Stenotrophomonas sp. PS02289 TaxID=2991422 RepID=UPI002499B64C|nr:hypothetical protein [Stenotrophomonas sp. PS02289]